MFQQSYWLCYSNPTNASSPNVSSSIEILLPQINNDFMMGKQEPFLHSTESHLSLFKTWLVIHQHHATRHFAHSHLVDLRLVNCHSTFFLPGVL
jgi:hypothetical protein